MQRTTFEYIKGREYAPKGEAWDKALAYWKTLKSDEDAVFDKEVRFAAEDIEPMITYGTNRGMGMGITQHIPTTEGMGEAAIFHEVYELYGFPTGENLCWVRRLTMCFWVPARMDALRISVHLPPL